MLPGGKCSVKVEASDGFNVGEGESKTFQVADRSPTIAILVNSTGGFVRLRGTGYDPEDRLLNSSAFNGH